MILHLPQNASKKSTTPTKETVYCRIATMDSVPPSSFDPAGHAHHFLSRLERVSHAEVDLALTLYRDHTLLRCLLEATRLPERAERVAISLDHPQEGPFVIITREGRFVTCLARGMSIGDLPVISHAQLQSVMLKTADMRARLEVRDHVLGEKGTFDELLKRIILAGPRLSREEFVAISSVQPLLADNFFRLLIQVAIDSDTSRKEILAILKRAPKVRPRRQPLLEAYWKQFWAMGHLAVLTSMGGEIPEPPSAPDEYSRPPRAIISGVTIQSGILTHALKGAFCIAKVGRPILSHYKQRHMSAPSERELIDAVVSLLALGSRHARMRAEVMKALSRATNYSNRSFEWIAEVTRRFVEKYEQKPDSINSICRQAGEEIAMAFAPLFPRGSRYAFERPEDVPDDLALTLALQGRYDFLADLKDIPYLLSLVPHAARTAPEQLYLPRDFVQIAFAPWSPGDTMSLLAGWERKGNKPPQPQKREGPSRQGPCPCGSGKKYKRCCEEKDKAKA